MRACVVCCSPPNLVVFLPPTLFSLRRFVSRRQLPPSPPAPNFLWNKTQSFLRRKSHNHIHHRVAKPPPYPLNSHVGQAPKLRQLVAFSSPPLPLIAPSNCAHRRNSGLKKTSPHPDQLILHPDAVR